MKERQGREHDVIRIQARYRRPARRGHPPEAMFGQHHALGASGGARGVNEKRGAMQIGRISRDTAGRGRTEPVQRQSGIVQSWRRHNDVLERWHLFTKALDQGKMMAGHHDGLAGRVLQAIKDFTLNRVMTDGYADTTST